MRPGGRFAVWLLLLASCTGGSPERALPRRTPAASPTATDSRVIGLVGTFSGGGVFSGEDAFEGADLAVQVMNRSSAEGRRRYELVTLDDRANPARSLRLLEELAASPRTVGIVYAGLPEVLPRAEPALARRGIPAILCYGDLYAARQLDAHIFQVSPSFLWESRRIASYLFQDRRYRDVGLLVEASFTGATASRAFRSVLADAGRAPVAVERYSHGSALRPLLERLKASRAEALVVHGGPAFLPELAAALRSLRAEYRGTPAARLASAAPDVRARRSRRRHWRPQVVAFDLALAPAPGASRLPPGTAAADSYARGLHYLPVPDFERFRESFRDWWGSPPTGLEGRAYDAARMIGWAAERAARQEDLARRLEGLAGERFGGAEVVFGPDDHTAVDPTDVGLWVVPRPGARVRERARLPDSLPWVPLARTFSTNGERTDIDSRDWRYLFQNPPPRRAPPPPFGRMLFGVTTGSSDPVH